MNGRRAKQIRRMAAAAAGQLRLASYRNLYRRLKLEYALVGWRVATGGGKQLQPVTIAVARPRGLAQMSTPLAPVIGSTGPLPTAGPR